MEPNEEPVPQPIAHEESEEQLRERKRQYNAEKSKRSYLKKKEQLLKTRILRRVGLGGAVNENTVANANGRFTEEEMKMLLQSKTNAAKARFVPVVTDAFADTHNADLIATSDGHFEFVAEDTSSEGYLITKERCANKTMTLDDAKRILRTVVKSPVRTLMKIATAKQREIAFNGYVSKLKIILEICGTNNLLDVYTNLDRFHNRLMASHIKPGSVKAYFSVLATLYRPEVTGALGADRFVKLTDLIHEDQAAKLTAYVNKGVKLSKDQAQIRTTEDICYDWNDFKKMLEVVRSHPERDTIRGMRDQLILHMYVYELVLRDDLGNVLIRRNTTKKDKKPMSDFEYSAQPNYVNLRTGKLCLYHYKTAKKFNLLDYENEALYRPFETVLFEDTMKLITDFVRKREEVTKKKVTYLIAKDDETLYKNGKLSGYIMDLFKRYTTPHDARVTANPLDISINTMRHSFVSRVRGAPNGMQYTAFLVDMMKHTYETDAEYVRKSAPVSFLDQTSIHVPTSLSVKPRCIVTIRNAGQDAKRCMARVITKTAIPSTNATDIQSYEYEVELRDKTRRTVVAPQVGFLEL